MRRYFYITEKEGVLLGRFYPLEQAPHVEVYFTTRVGGLSAGAWESLNIDPAGGDRPESVAANQDKVLKALKIQGVFFPKQVHGKKILSVVKKPVGFSYGHEGDAAVSDLSDAAVGVMTADCLPLMLFHSRRAIVAAVHVGWRGVVKEIAPAAVNFILKEWSLKARDMGAYLGPCIGPCCYEVDDDTALKMARAAGDRSIIRAAGPKPKVDIGMAVSRQLETVGLKDKNIVSAGLCTSCNKELFYSYRRDGGNTGRMAGIIMMRT